MESKGNWERGGRREEEEKEKEEEEKIDRVDMVCCCSFFCWQRAFVRWFVTHRGLEEHRTTYRLRGELVGDHRKRSCPVRLLHESWGIVRKEKDAFLGLRSQVLSLHAVRGHAASCIHWTGMMDISCRHTSETCRATWPCTFSLSLSLTRFSSTSLHTYFSWLSCARFALFLSLYVILSLCLTVRFSPQTLFRNPSRNVHM